MRNKFDEQLEHLNDGLIEMGGLVETAIANAVSALISCDVSMAKSAMECEEEVNQKEKELENLCLKLILRQQPVASDLRMISSALKMITDMERIGDQAIDISEIAIMTAKHEYVKKVDHIPQMARATIKMVNDCIDAFVKKDVKMAEAVIEYDDVVDRLFDKTKEDLIQLIKQNSDLGSSAMDLLMVAKYFERIGDHAVNIAGWVVFSLTGKHA
ncbi:MAG: phosphate signaling complex protein PhoU [Oscillospiraceae bacterium]